MTLWSIFVCGVIRLDLNIDYDRLHELVNQHNTIRQMLGHGLFDPTSYHHQTLKDNVTLFTPELLNKINQIVVDAGVMNWSKKRLIMDSRLVRNESDVRGALDNAQGIPYALLGRNT
jgi:hypothetical protein